MSNQDKMTHPAMPAAIKKNHRPTLILKTPIESKEERDPGRYCIIDPGRSKH